MHARKAYRLPILRELLTRAPAGLPGAFERLRLTLCRMFPNEADSIVVGRPRRRQGAEGAQEMELAEGLVL